MWRPITEEHLYYKGGGNGAMIAMMMQMEKNAQLAKEQEQARVDKADQLARETRAAEEAKAAQAKIDSQNRVAGAYEGAKSSGKQRLLAKGMDVDNDPYGIMSLFTSQLDRARSSAPEIVTDPSSIFSDTLLDNALNEARGTQRSKYGSLVKNNFSDSYGLDTFADTADDAYLTSILDTQKTDAQLALERALARGTINEVGKAKGDSELSNMYKTGLARANSLGDTVLGGYRSQLDDRVGKIRTTANNWDFGDNFNFDNEKAGVDTLKGSLSSKLEGDILNALAGQSFFDENTLLGKAGTATGITNNPLNVSNTPLLGSTSAVTGKTKQPTDNRKLTALDEVF